MNYKELKKEIRKRMRKDYKWRGSLTEYPTILLFTYGRKFGTLKHFDYDGWNIEEQPDGSWKTYYTERNKESFVSFYSSEEEACDSFLREVEKYI